MQERIYWLPSLGRRDSFIQGSVYLFTLDAGKVANDAKLETKNFFRHLLN